MNTKTIAIVAAVIIIVIVAAAVVVVMGSDDDDDDPVVTYNWGSGAALLVLGNADGDEKLDSTDVSMIESKYGESVEEYPWYDANWDGVIDSRDTEFVQDLVDNKSGTANVLCVDRNGENTVVKIDYPLRYAVTFTGNINADVLLCGGQQYIVAYNSAGYGHLEADLKSVSGITDLGGSSMNFAFDKFIQVDGDVQKINGKGVGALIADASRKVNLDKYYDQFETTGIPLLMLNTITMSDQLSAVVTLGYLFGPECYAQAMTYMETVKPIADEITAAVSKLSDSQKENAVAIVMGSYLAASISGYYETLVDAGVVPYYQVNTRFADAVSGGSSVALSTTENILVNYDNDIDFIMSARSIDSKSSNLGKTITDLWVQYQTYYENLDCYKNFFYVNALLPAVVKVAYVVETIYPEIVPSGYGDSVFDRVVTVSPNYLSGCTTKNTFTRVTYDIYNGVKDGSITFDVVTPVDPDVPVVTDASAKAIADYYVKKNPTTAYTHDAKSIAEAIAASGDTSIGTWAVVDGATEDSAKVNFTYQSTTGKTVERVFNVLRTSDAASQYATLAYEISNNGSYTVFDTSSISDVNVTAATRILPVGSLVVMFAIQSGSIVVEDTNGLVNLGPSGTVEHALTIVKTIADIVKSGNSYATWTVADGATDESATLQYTYTNNSGTTNTRNFQITTGISESRYKTTADALAESAGSYRLLDVDLDNENVKVTAYGRTMGSAYLLKFVMYYNGAMIEVTSNAIYINNGVALEAQTILKNFATAIVAGGGNIDGGSTTSSALFAANVFTAAITVAA